MQLNQHRIRVLLFVLLCAAWNFPGLVGRDPWKADEAYSFGLVLNMVQTGDWVVPTLGADPFMEKPPIFYILATLCAHILSPPFALHEAARMACVLALALTLLSIALASRELNGPGTGWVAAVLMLGCIGLVHTAHMLMTDNMLLAGYSLALYGVALGRRKPWVGGLICGTGTGIAFLSKGLLGPGILGITVLFLPVCFKSWRSRGYWYLLGGIFLAVLPWVTIWPALLYHRSSTLFMTWAWDNNFGRFLGSSAVAPESKGTFYLAKKIPYFAFPAFPLALWYFWKERRAAFKDGGAGLPLLAFVAALVVLSVSFQTREVYALPMLAPLTLLGARAVDGVSLGWSKGLTRSFFVIFSIAAVAAWVGWLLLLNGYPPVLVERLQAKIPHFTPSYHLWAYAAALVLTVGWVWLVIRNRLESRMVWVHWAAGIALLYGLGMTLWLPVTNGNMSYRRDFDGLREALGPQPGLVVSKNIGEPQRAVLHYYAGLTTHREESRGPTNSHWLLIQGENANGQQPAPPDNTWRQVWEGRHHRELFRLYRRTGMPNPQ